MTEPLWPRRLDREATAIATRLTDALLERLLVVPPGLEARVYEAMRYSALAPGKRLRPVPGAGRRRRCSAWRGAARLQVAAAIEMVHAYSLIHDDLPAMDDSDLRRGRPTCHKQFDEATAILAGDGLLTMAFEVLAAPRHAWRSGGALRAGRGAGGGGRPGRHGRRPDDRSDRRDDARSTSARSPGCSA